MTLVETSSGDVVMAKVAHDRLTSLNLCISAVYSTEIVESGQILDY